MELTRTQIAILRSLLYFDLFSHPLEKAELFGLIRATPLPEDFETELTGLVEKGVVRVESGYCFISNGGTSVNERINRMKRVRRYQRIARSISRLIHMHPFVRAVLISGSLSKRSISKKDDIDFFVVAKPGRVWICKSFLMLFKKIFLFNSKKYFCINYFIDTNSLEIPEKNLFTATELASLVPMVNPHICRKLMDCNPWILDHYPNFSIQMAECRELSDPWLKKITERFLAGAIGDRLDSGLMKIYRNRIQRKFGKMDPLVFTKNFRTEKNISKYHPNGFQQAILDRFESRVTEFEKLQGLKLENLA